MQLIFRTLLLLAPAEFRRRYGRELRADFETAARDGLQLNACADLFTTIIRERTSNVMRTLSYTIRSLIRTPGVTLVMILTLAIGIGANVAAFAVINGVLLNPLPFPHADRIVAVWRKTWINGVVCNACPHSFFSAFAYRAENTTFEGMAGYQGWSGVVSTGTGAAQNIRGAQVGVQFLDVLGVRPALGRGFTQDDERYGAPRVALVSYAFWSQQLHGQASAIGKAIALDGKTFRLIGVLPPNFFFPNFTRGITEHPAVLIAVRHSPGLRPGNNGAGLIGRLKNGVTPAQAKADIDRIIAGLSKKYKDYVQDGHLEQVNVRPLRDDLFGPSSVLLLPIFGAVFIVLLIACTNVANLLIARTIGRRRDLAMRMAVGATRRHVVGQVACESLTLAAAGTLLGVLGANYAVKAYVALNPPGIHRADQITIDARVVAYAAGIAIITALLTSVLPALVTIGREALTPLIGGRSQIGGRTNTARAALVIVQIACAFALVVACGLLVRSLHAYASADLGYRTDRLVAVYGPPISIGFYPSVSAQQAYLERLHDNLAALPGVDGVSYGTAVPLVGGGSDGVFDMAGAPKDADADFEFVSPQYFHTLGVPLLHGRDITSADGPNAARVAVVDAEFVKRFIRDGRAIGKHFKYGNVDFTIVGVVPHVTLHYVGESAYPSMYFPLRQLPQIWQTDLSGFFIPFVLHTSVPPANLGSAVTKAWHSADTREPAPDLATIPVLIDRDTANTRANVFVLGTLALIALLLAISGTGSVAAYAIARRTNEIGIRMALGAPRWRIVRALLGSAVTMLAIGLIAGIGLSVAAAGALAPQLYQTPPYDVSTYFAVALILAAATLVASFIPAYGAASSDPSRALRYE